MLQTNEHGENGDDDGDEGANEDGDDDGDAHDDGGVGDDDDDANGDGGDDPVYDSGCDHDKDGHGHDAGATSWARRDLGRERFEGQPKTNDRGAAAHRWCVEFRRIPSHSKKWTFAIWVLLKSHCCIGCLPKLA